MLRPPVRRVSREVEVQRASQEMRDLSIDEEGIQILLIDQTIPLPIAQIGTYPVDPKHIRIKYGIQEDLSRALTMRHNCGVLSQRKTSTE
jgi:hypothetical protein